MRLFAFACVCDRPRARIHAFIYVRDVNSIYRASNKITCAHIHINIYLAWPFARLRTSIAPRVQSLKKRSSTENCLTIGNGQRSRSIISFVLVARVCNCHAMVTIVANAVTLVRQDK